MANLGATPRCTPSQIGHVADEEEMARPERFELPATLGSKPIRPVPRSLSYQSSDLSFGINEILVRARSIAGLANVDFWMVSSR